MIDQSEQALTPKLRFPEFEDRPGWEMRDLGPLTTKVGSGITPRGGEKTYKQTGRPFIRSQNVGWGKLLLDEMAYIDEETHKSFDATELRFSDVLLNITGASIGRSALASEIIAGGNVNQHVCIIRVKQEELNPFFVNQYILSENGQKQIDSFQAGGNRQGLNFAQIRSFLVPLPCDRSEQQKIADCLRSLDDLLAAEGRKLEAFRDHKKGLMQQLFPQPGETRPRLRFPEFHDAGEWDTMSLGQLLARTPDYGVNASAVPYSKDLPTYIRITDINDDGRFITEGRTSVAIEAKENNFLHDGDIVLARTGASVGKSYRYRLEDGRLVFAGFLIRVRPNPKRLLTDFLIGFLATRTYWDWVSVTSTRSGQPGINGAEYASLPIPVPPIQSGSQGLIEQQQIAECLTSLDDLASAQADRIAVLQAFKRGLMQNLFPSSEYMER